jgi:hypothetical protein
MYDFQTLNTNVALVSICQNDKFSFSFLQNTYLNLTQAITSTIATLGYWYIQRYWKISTKKMVRHPDNLHTPHVTDMLLFIVRRD